MRRAGVRSLRTTLLGILAASLAACGGAIPAQSTPDALAGQYIVNGGGGALEIVKALTDAFGKRSEEHTSELQSRGHLVCRLLLEKKKKKNKQEHTHRNAQMK